MNRINCYHGITISKCMCTDITVPEPAKFDIDIGAETHLTKISSIFNYFWPNN